MVYGANNSRWKKGLFPWPVFRAIAPCLEALEGPVPRPMPIFNKAYIEIGIALISFKYMFQQ
jgi:hypothetical protein